MSNRGLPNGLVWSKTPANQEISRDDIVEQLESFSENVALEIANTIFEKGVTRVVIPISGGIVAYIHLMNSLKNQRIDFSKLDLVFAYHPKGSEEYKLSKDCSNILTTFVVDDIYDQGKSFASIAISLGMPKETVIPRYLSTKVGVELPHNINRDLFEFIKEWLTTAFGMDGSLNGLDENGSIVNPYLYYMSEIIGMLERVVAKPIAVEDPASGAINNWTKDDVNQYLNALTRPNISLANGNRKLEEDLLIIFSTIVALKQEGEEALFAYLNKLHQSYLEIEA